MFPTHRRGDRRRHYLASSVYRPSFPRSAATSGQPSLTKRPRKRCKTAAALRAKPVSRNLAIPPGPGELDRRASGRASIATCRPPLTPRPAP